MLHPRSSKYYILVVAKIYQVEDVTPSSHSSRSFLAKFGITRRNLTSSKKSWEPWELREPLHGVILSVVRYGLKSKKSERYSRFGWVDIVRFRRFM